MWRCVKVETTIDQPIQRVFAYYADPATWHEFVPAVALRRKLGDGPIAIGTRFEAVDRIGPFTVSFVDELVEMEPPRRLVWRSSAPWNATTEYRFEPIAEGTRARAIYAGDIGGWLRLLAWVPGPVIARVLAQDFRRLGALLAER